MVKVGMCGKGGPWWGCMYGGGVLHGVCVVGGAWQGGACVAGEMATAADSTHPTGMHSCLTSN